MHLFQTFPSWAHRLQICFILKRLYVHESIYTVFLEELVKATKQLKVGNGTDETTHIGPIQNEMQYEKLRRIIQDIENSGSRFVIGGRPPSSGSGYFINPTIVDCPDDKSRIVVEEQFGMPSILCRACSPG